VDTFENLDRAPNLTIIDLHNNKLVLLPEEVTELRKLKTLKVSNNDLSDLNPRLALLSSLVRINIEGNPLKCIKTTLRGAGAEPLK
jgi:Leucine-rich repeat (LRR) protein